MKNQNLENNRISKTQSGILDLSLGCKAVKQINENKIVLISEYESFSLVFWQL